jgi:hypothetical protein
MPAFLWAERRPNLHPLQIGLIADLRPGFFPADVFQGTADFPDWDDRTFRYLHVALLHR